MWMWTYEAWMVNVNFSAFTSRKPVAGWMETPKLGRTEQKWILFMLYSLTFLKTRIFGRLSFTQHVYSSCLISIASLSVLSMYKSINVLIYNISIVKFVSSKRFKGNCIYFTSLHYWYASSRKSLTKLLDLEFTHCRVFLITVVMCCYPPNTRPEEIFKSSYRIRLQ